MTARCAIYFAPAHGSPWWQFGAHWLGRDERYDWPLAQFVPSLIGVDEMRAITLEPRRYGFHATLKAPFRLRGKHTVEDLNARMQGLASTLEPVTLGPLRMTTLGNFVALVPDTTPVGLQDLAAACVKELDDLRAPLEDADLKRRRAKQLDLREAELLAQYGYPYVMERFRFHFTLTGQIAHAAQQWVAQAVGTELARLNEEVPLTLDRLCLFVEPWPGAKFQRVADAQVGT